VNPPNTLLTEKRESANNANSALASTRNKRICIFSEPEAKHPIQASTLKLYSGGDLISTRELHSSQIEFKPHFKMFIMCNKYPPITDTDGGITRRLMINDFLSQFKDDPDPNKPNEFKKDYTLKEKLKSYAPVFFCVLLDYYRLYKKEGLTPPEEVLAASRKYEYNNNLMKQFIEEYIIYDPKGHITKDELKQIYTSDSTIYRAFSKFSLFTAELENSTGFDFKKTKSDSRITGIRIRVDMENED
jgi:phage/plasmid-associated DNA primase